LESKHLIDDNKGYHLCSVAFCRVGDVRQRHVADPGALWFASTATLCSTVTQQPSRPPGDTPSIPEQVFNQIYQYPHQDLHRHLFNGHINLPQNPPHYAYLANAAKAASAAWRGGPELGRCAELPRRCAGDQPTVPLGSPRIVHAELSEMGVTPPALFTSDHRPKMTTPPGWAAQEGHAWTSRCSQRPC